MTMKSKFRREMITKSIIVTLVIVALAVPVVNVSASSKPEIVPPVITGSGSGSMCPDGYSRTEDGENCKLRDVQCDEDPDDSLCNGERGREGLIFCDVQYQEEGSKSSCYDRNDNPEQYCLMHPGDPWDFCTKENICDQDGSIKPDDEYCRGNY
jgi:hypothetical protein